VLVPADANGQTDVYEWEREGTGSCERTSAGFSETSGGCLYLISTGQSTQSSYFGDASADGSNVFFFTRQSLVGQDRDENADVYDARVGGGIAAQNRLPRVGCTGEGCLGPAASPPVLGALSSTTLTGDDNLKPPLIKPKKVVARCPKGKKRSHRKCAKKKKRRARR